MVIMSLVSLLVLSKWVVTYCDVLQWKSHIAM